MRLPVELLGRIFRECEDTDLRCAARANTVANVEAERVLYESLAFEHVVPLLRLRLALKRSADTRRTRRLRTIRRLVIRLDNLTPAFDMYRQTYGSLFFLCRKAMLREVAYFIAGCPCLSSLELHVPMLPGASEPLDPRLLLTATFELETLDLDLPYTHSLAAFLMMQSRSLKNLKLIPPVRPMLPFVPTPHLPRLQRLDTVEELSTLWPCVRSLRVASIFTDVLGLIPRAGPQLSKLTDLHVLRINALTSPNTVFGVASYLPMLRGLTIDVSSQPNTARDTPWDDDSWAVAFSRMNALVNFRLRLKQLRRRAHPWDARKKPALEKWHSGCPTLRHVAFPGEQDHWSWNSHRQIWREPTA
ncbi:hypothetical protein EXIGLDRAFT_753218 [Exidia glandulosa HHB12029]|uniref:Uncharacterized protein n=1 Tax=Exidia glandulosa HHB12029 TaxID=1314781 RepID=A0A165DXN7_EXIGL|nr:hypothetical protein EXIGLDRAFT_847458 [Exidia glandulosa HHB12029]KZV85605.1 hypothetical protein EXIGLDRAFT_753218 [Exidia glandulosa HHB12029]